MRCFVIMPFGDLHKDAKRREELDFLFQEIIVPAVETVRIPGHPTEQIQCIRGDCEPRPGQVIDQVIANLVECELAIVDLPGRTSQKSYRPARGSQR